VFLGVTQAVCELGQAPIWPSDLKLLPNIQQCDILFIKKCDWNDDMIDTIFSSHFHSGRNSGFFVY
jgi:hypothetical protein